MNYFIKRDAAEYGPYTLSDIQRYVAQGNIALTDLARSEGMADWVPVAQVMGNIPAPAPVAYAGTPGYGGPAYGVAPQTTAGPIPPDFHWALVLLLGFVTCGLFWSAWSIVEAAWIRKIKPGSNGLPLIISGVVANFVGGFFNGFMRGLTHTAFVPYPIFSLIGFVLLLVGFFSMRSDLEDYYNTTENIGLRLSGVMTFFFAVFYFQHHFSRIARWKKTGVLEPQG